MLKPTIPKHNRIILTSRELCNSGNYLAAYNIKEVEYFYIPRCVVALLPKSEWMNEATAQNKMLMFKSLFLFLLFFLQNALYL